MKKNLLTMVLTLCFTNVFAFDVNGIHYSVQDNTAKTVRVTCKSVRIIYGDGDFNFVYAYTSDYTGDVVIPAIIEYNGENYTVTRISSHAFENCSGVTSIVLPSTITEVSDDAFYGCNNIKTVSCDAVVVPTAYSSSFTSTVYSNATLYVPTESIDLYDSTTPWSNFSKIEGNSTKLDLTDATPELDSYKHSAGDITYIRSGSAIKKGNYGTFCVPFDIDLTSTSCFQGAYVPTGFAFYNADENSLRIGFEEITNTIEAGTPFLAQVADVSEVLLTSKSDFDFSSAVPQITDTEIKTYDYGKHSGIMLRNKNYEMTFSGTYSRISPENLNTFNTNGSWGPSTSVSPFRAYILEIENATNARIIVDLGNETDGIENISNNTNSVNDRVYNILGQRVNKNNGILIINGKKIIK